ncbi:glucose PTS transporter subunit IIA [Lactiplantibacillus daowaiensis]|uniref:Glucose PTS transporter subunit IIA n=1 Tax=Lactiplantibacillus daowaiensis TaxID=2559918 RepID=A0ABW1RZH0_9LACO|nr:PTS glucose transporter subunit IIABC [Lactiplantibacillus daowaiensis]
MSSTAKTITPVVAPVTGQVIPLMQVTDAAFSKGLLGIGCGLNPQTGQVVAPVTGQVMMVAETKHAVGFKLSNGAEVLLHLGLDTVELAGRPFQIRVEVGDQVQAGQLIGTMDLAAIEMAHKKATVMVTVTNAAAINATWLSAATSSYQAGQVLAGLTVAPKVSVATVETSTMQPAELATAIIQDVGGPANILNLIHCMTRLRFDLATPSKADTVALKQLAGVLTVTQAGGQYQVVIGDQVAAVAAAIQTQLGVGDVSAKPTVGHALTVLPWLKRGLSQFVGVLTASMMPLIGVLAGAGLLKGILAALVGFHVMTTAGGTYLVLNAVSDAVFYFLPVMLGYTAAQKLGANPVTLAVVGAVLTYPSLVTAASKTTTAHIYFFGLPTTLMSYTAAVFPMIVAAWFGKYIEIGLKRWLPHYIQGVLLPIIEIIVLSGVILLGIGPLTTMLSQGLANGIMALFEFNPIISGLLVGSCYQLLVIFGLHWGLIPIVINDLATNGHSYLNTMISITMVAQGGTALAMALKSRSTRLRQVAWAAAIAAFCGITEPALYGINLKYKRLFVVASLASGLGGMVAGGLHVTNYALSGALIGFSAFITPSVGIGPNFYGYLVTHYGTLVVAVLLGLVVSLAGKRPAQSLTDLSA